MIVAMATDVVCTAEINAPVAEVFAYVDDFGHAQEWIYGLTSIEAVGEPTHGVGATFDGTMKVGMAFHSTIRCTRWEQDRLLELESIKGLSNTQTWTFEDLGDERTRVTAQVSYTLPGGPVGLTMARAIKPFVGIAIRSTSEHLTKNVEGLRRG